MTRSCIDLFSGAGGLSEGLSQAGFHSLYASEIVALTLGRIKKIIHRLLSKLRIFEP